MPFLAASSSFGSNGLETRTWNSSHLSESAVKDSPPVDFAPGSTSFNHSWNSRPLKTRLFRLTLSNLHNRIPCDNANPKMIVTNRISRRDISNFFKHLHRFANFRIEIQYVQTCGKRGRDLTCVGIRPILSGSRRGVKDGSLGGLKTTWVSYSTDPAHLQSLPPVTPIHCQKSSTSLVFIPKVRDLSVICNFVVPLHNFYS